jgi:hypothetical protein
MKKPACGPVFLRLDILKLRHKQTGPRRFFYGCSAHKKSRPAGLLSVSA